MQTYSLKGERVLVCRLVFGNLDLDGRLEVLDLACLFVSDVFENHIYCIVAE